MTGVAAGLRRFAAVLAVFAAATAAVSSAVGALLGASELRALSLGFYLVGSGLVVAGFFLGNRGPVRLGAAQDRDILGLRSLHWALPGEREESIASSAVFVATGFALIALGMAADTRYPLV